MAFTTELERDSALNLSQAADGTFNLYLTGIPYNPDRYTLVTKEQLRYSYDQFGDIELLSISDRNGVTLKFDETGIQSSAGPRITWERDASGRIQHILDPDGNSLEYAYDSHGRLLSFQDQEGNITSYSYVDDPYGFTTGLRSKRPRLRARQGGAWTAP